MAKARAQSTKPKPKTKSKTKALAVTSIDPNVPTYLSAIDVDAPDGAEDLIQYVVPPRIKVVQAQSTELLEKDHSPGDVLVPSLDLILGTMPYTKSKPLPDQMDSFRITPVFVFSEYVVTNPYGGDEAFIRDRSLDPHGRIAMRCKNPSTREEPHPTLSGKVIKNAEFLNFVLWFHDMSPEIEEHQRQTPFVLTFKGASYKWGRELATLMTKRRINGKRAPYWSCVFDMWIEHDTNDQGAWFGFHVDNPDDGPAWVKDPKLFETLAAMRAEISEAHAAQRIVVDYDEPTVTTDKATVATTDADNDVPF